MVKKIKLTVTNLSNLLLLYTSIIHSVNRHTQEYFSKKMILC